MSEGRYKVWVAVEEVDKNGEHVSDVGDLDWATEFETDDLLQAVAFATRLHGYGEALARDEEWK